MAFCCEWLQLVTILHVISSSQSSLPYRCSISATGETSLAFIPSRPDEPPENFFDPMNVEKYARQGVLQMSEILTYIFSIEVDSNCSGTVNAVEYCFQTGTTAPNLTFASLTKHPSNGRFGVTVRTANSADRTCIVANVQSSLNHLLFHKLQTSHLV